MIQRDKNTLDVKKEKLKKLADLTDILKSRHRCIRQLLMLQLDEVWEGNCSTNGSEICQFCSQNRDCQEMDVTLIVHSLIRGLNQHGHLKENEFVAILTGTYHNPLEWISISGLLKSWPVDLVKYLKDELVLKHILEKRFELRDGIPIKLLKASKIGAEYLAKNLQLVICPTVDLAILRTNPWNREHHKSSENVWRENVSRRHLVSNARFYPKKKKKAAASGWSCILESLY